MRSSVCFVLAASLKAVSQAACVGSYVTRQHKRTKATRSQVSFLLFFYILLSFSLQVNSSIQQTQIGQRVNGHVQTRGLPASPQRTQVVHCLQIYQAFNVLVQQTQIDQRVHSHVQGRLGQPHIPYRRRLGFPALHQRAQQVQLLLQQHHNGGQAVEKR